MNRRLIGSVVIACMVMALAGCGKKEETTTYEVGKNVTDEAAESVSDEAGAADEKDASGSERLVDIKEITRQLLRSIDYDDELSEVDLDTAKMFLNIGDIDITESSIYESSGATAEEIVVLKCTDSDGAAKAKEAFNARVAEQTENFTDYVPEEVPKLKEAVIITSKEYAVLVVSGDANKAKKIIEDEFIK